MIPVNRSPDLHIFQTLNKTLKPYEPSPPWKSAANLTNKLNRDTIQLTKINTIAIYIKILYHFGLEVEMTIDHQAATNYLWRQTLTRSKPCAEVRRSELYPLLHHIPSQRCT